MKSSGTLATIIFCVVVSAALGIYSWQGYLPPFPAAAIATLIVLAIIIIVPRRLVRKGVPDIEKKGPLELENDYRQTLVQIVGGVAIIVTVYSAFQGYDLSRRGQIADRTYKALEMLAKSGSEDATAAANTSKAEKAPKDNTDSKVAAVYVLEQIANEDKASEWPILEISFNYVRVHAKWSKLSPPEPPEALSPDIGAILDFMRRRPFSSEYQQQFDYSNCETNPCERTGSNDHNFRMINFPEVDLRGAFLQGAMMKAVILRDAHLEQAQLNNAHFEKSWAEGAHFEDADLTGSYWTLATLRRTRFDRVRMSGSHLSNADLGDADLSCADMTGAALQYANLGGTNLAGANLNGADLTGAKYLTTEQLSKAVGDASTKLPADVKPPQWSSVQDSGCPLAVVSVVTDPPDAEILVDGNSVAHTPAKFFLKRNGDKPRDILISLKGYQSIDKRIWPPGGLFRMTLVLQKAETIPSY
jgi:uncharacterized protein YjbI with pentapeptide repeats